MKTILKAFGQPFPEDDSLAAILRTAGTVGLFIAFFLYAFRPFGLGNYEGNLLLLTLRFGLVTMAGTLLVYLVVRYVLNIRKDLPTWTLGKWLIEVIIVTMVIGVGNYFFVGWEVGQVWRGWYILGVMVANTLLVGILPISLSGMLIQLRAQRKNEAVAANISEHLEKPAVPLAKEPLLLQGEHDSLAVPAHSICYIEAMQNYVAVYYEQDGALKRELFRATLSSLSDQLTAETIHRCHRSYLVNTDRVAEVSGNAQGLRLRLNGLPAGTEIPVSRTYIPQIKDVLS